MSTASALRAWETRRANAASKAAAMAAAKDKRISDWRSGRPAVSDDGRGRGDREVKMAALKPTFEEWLRLVDVYVLAKCGLSYDDLEDCPYRDWFDDGMRPSTAAAKAIKRAGGP